MPLPTAVKRNAEKALQSVAARSGKTQAAPLQSGDEYLDIPSTTSDVTQATVPHALSNVEDVSPVDLSDKQDSDQGVQDTTRSSQPDFIDPQDWKGRYAALRAARNDRVDTLQQQVTELTTQNRSLSEKLEKATRQDQAAAQKEFDDKAKTAFGDEGAELLNQINDRIDTRFDAQAKRTMSVFESNMDSLIPNWRTINVQPGFLQYLAGVDDVMGISRQTMLDKIVDDRDAESAAAMFRKYAAVANGVTQQRNGQQVPELNTSRSSTGLGAEENLVEEWSESEIADFYQKKNRLYQAGKLRGAMLENVEADEARIRKAMAEGRVYKG